jgi:hypothetical protein
MLGFFFCVGIQASVLAVRSRADRIVIVAKPAGHGTGSRCGVSPVNILMLVGTERGSDRSLNMNEVLIEFRIRRYYQTGVITEAEMWELLVLNWLT